MNEKRDLNAICTCMQLNNMDIISDNKQFQLNTDCAVAIGKFDGVHLGHRKLINVLKAECNKRNLAPVVFTFDPSPAVFFSKDKVFRELSTRDEKRRLFEMAGIDALIEFPLDAESAATEPENFIRDILVRMMHTKAICAGPDLSFGHMGKGNLELIRLLQSECGYDVVTVDKEFYEDEEISSSRIRAAISEGRMEEATAMLGAPYSLTGKVLHGNRIGRTIGFPTINQEAPDEKLMPPFGVYKSIVQIGDKPFQGITNIGVKPTVSHAHVMSAETFLYDFEGDLYDREVTLELLHFKRPEQKFHSIDELKEQIARDIAEP